MSNQNVVKISLLMEHRMLCDDDAKVVQIILKEISDGTRVLPT